jgi:hypothetical protein
MISTTPKNHAFMIHEFPIPGMVEGWYFRITETSNGCFLVEGSDCYGRKVSLQGDRDPDVMLAECIEFANECIRCHSHQQVPGNT